MLSVLFLSVLSMMGCFIYMELGLIVILFFMLMLVIWGLPFMSSGLMVCSGGCVSILSWSLIFLLLWVVIFMFLVEMKPFSSFQQFYLFMLMGFSLLLFFSVDSYFCFYLFFEVVLIPVVFLIYFYGSNFERSSSGTYLLLYTLAASLPLLWAIFLLSENNTLSFVLVSIQWLELKSFETGFSLALLGAFFVKLPIYGFHLWLPKAHVEASLPGSMILAGLLLKLGGFGIYHFLPLLCYFSMGAWSPYFYSLALVGGTFTGFICLRQVDFKSLIAYSSVCHMSLVLVGGFSLSGGGLVGSLFLMLGHGLCSSALFFLVNFYYERTYTRSLAMLSGLGLICPSIFYWWFVFSAFNMGAPPSMNLLGEVLLMGAGLKWSFFSVLFLGIMSLISGAYSIFIFSHSQHGKAWFFYSMKSLELKELLFLFSHVVLILGYILKPGLAELG